MSCAEGVVHVCAPRATAASKRRRRCSTCEARRTMVGFFYEWYGWHVTCLGCGESWEDGEMLERPFSPGWRRQRIASARQLWQRHQGAQASV